MSRLPTVILLMRKKRTNYYSVERLFENLVPPLSRQFDVRVVHVPCFGVSPVEFIRNLIFTARLRADVIHVTGDIQYCALAVPRQRCVLTVLDLVSLNRLKGPRKHVLSLLWYSLPLRWAQHVTSISEESRNQLERSYPAAVGRVSVVSCCADPAFERNKVFAHADTDRPRVLQVGTSANKNVHRVALAASGLPLHLRIIGPLSDDLRTLLSNLDLEWSSAEQLSTEELIKEYQNSDALVFASTYEGFGLPIVEAQSIGLPVLTSKIQPMTDVAGEGALFVDPYSEFEIRSGLEQLLSSPDLCRRLVEQGRNNVKRFDVRIVADQYAKIYADVLNRN
jgi:glycosyltransferase involved in cell wall biosynthesis